MGKATALCWGQSDEDRCPIQAECLGIALEAGDYGRGLLTAVFGGMTTTQRGLWAKEFTDRAEEVPVLLPRSAYLRGPAGINSLSTTKEDEPNDAVPPEVSREEELHQWPVIDLKESAGEFTRDVAGSWSLGRYYLSRHDLVAFLRCMETSDPYGALLAKAEVKQAHHREQIRQSRAAGAPELRATA